MTTQAAEAVLQKTTDASILREQVNGYNWNNGLDYDKLLKSYLHSGFQATNFGLAVEEVNKMIACRKSPIPEDKYIDNEDAFTGVKHNCTIFLGYTSNIVSSGLRETIKFLVQHKMIDCIVTTAGGVEEDLIKCMAPTFLGDFSLNGNMLGENGIDKIGNLLVPNNNYCHFENWIMPILDQMLLEQKNDNVLWTPSKMIVRFGEEIKNEDSIYYWAAKNQIPVFCPTLTVGSIGIAMFRHFCRNPGLISTIISDTSNLNMMAMRAVNTGMIIIGGGLVKHHICNANLMRNGAEFSVYLNTASEFDGSDSGARPDEAKSWGKIKKDATPVKIYAEATLIFPLLVAQTFAKNYEKNKDNNSP